MSRKKHRQTPGYQWEESLLEAYYDFRWRQVLDPLYDNFQRWKPGELDHTEMDKAIHQTHKKTQELYGVFTLKHEWSISRYYFTSSSAITALPC